MKKRIIIGFSIVLITLSFALGDFSTATDTSNLPDQETTITGMVAQKGDTIILQAIDGYQFTITGQDLSNMVGRKVQATGKFIKDKDKSWFKANKIIELPDKKTGPHQPFVPARQ